MTDITGTPEYQEGEEAYRNGATTRDNPYCFMSEAAFRWQEGLLGNGRPGQRENKIPM